MAGQTLDYDALNNSFSDTDMSNWILSEHVENYISYCIGLDRDKKMNTIKFVPDVYLPNTKPGARSPLSVEAAQNMMYKLSNAYEDALARETRRATSSEQTLSKFMKDNMVTKSEDQTITGDKELTGHTTVKDLNVTTRLNIPQGAPSNPQVGDIWYDPTISSSGGGSTSVVARTISLQDEGANGVSMYDGSTYVGTFKTDTTVNDISLSGKTIKIPKGISSNNLTNSDSIEINKDNNIKFNVKNDFIENIVSTLLPNSIDPIYEEISNIGTVAQSSALKVDTLETTMQESNVSFNEKIQNNSDRIDGIISRFESDGGINDELNGLTTEVNRVSNLIESENDGISSKLSALTTKVNALESSIILLKMKVDALETKVNTLHPTN